MMPNLYFNLALDVSQMSTPTYWKCAWQLICQLLKGEFNCGVDRSFRLNLYQMPELT